MPLSWSLCPHPGAQDFVIAADKGYEALEAYGVPPDLVVGDFDSLGRRPSHPNVIQLPSAKDDTDMVYALREGLDRGFRRFVLLGGVGGRLEHTLANLQALSWLTTQGARGVLAGRPQGRPAGHVAGAGGFLPPAAPAVEPGANPTRRRMTMDHTVKALVLAAGKGTRLQTEGIDLPKVMRLADGKPLLHYVLSALDFLPPEDVILVVGWKKEAVLEAYPQYPHAVQAEQHGTGHAVQCAAHLLEGFQGHVIICCGDAPLMKKETFQALADTHLREGNACTLLSAVLPEGGNYGRILREADGSFRAIVEDKDCTPEQKQIREVNTGTYVFHVPELLSSLGRLKNDNAQGELYLTDVPAFIKEAGGRVGLCDTCSPDEMLGVNTVEQLQEVEAILRKGGVSRG